MVTPAGWYADPYDPSQLRYWDGAAWTDSATASATGHGGGPGHDVGGGWGLLGGPGPPQGSESGGQGAAGDLSRDQTAVMATAPDLRSGAGSAPRSASRSIGGSAGLGEVGSWLESVFGVLGRRFVAVLLLVYLIPAAGLVTAALLARDVAAGIRIRPGVGFEREAFEGFSAGDLIAPQVVLVVTAIVSAICVLAAHHQLLTAHRRAPATLWSSLAVGLRRLPRAIGWGIVGFLAWIAASIVIGAIVVGIVAIATDPTPERFAIASVLMILLVLALIVVGVWLWIRLAFWTTAVAVAPRRRDPFSASWSVSRGRFWGVLGRLILLIIIVSLVAGFIGTIVQVAVAAAIPTLVTVDPATQEILFDGRPVEDFELIALGDFVPGRVDTVLFTALSLLSAAVARALTISGLTGLYARSDAPAAD